MDRVGGIGVGVAVGWNLAILGPIATQLSHAYGVGLATIGLFVTVQFVAHMLMQVPGGRAADRLGARTSAMVGLAFVAAGNAISLPVADPALGFAGRAVVGIGTGFGFVGGSDYIRARGGSPFLQGLYGGGSVLAPGFAIALMPRLESGIGFRAPFISAIVVTGVCAVLLALAPAAARTVRHAEGCGCDLADLTLADLQRFAPLVAGDVYDVLTLDGSVASRNHPGGTAPVQVRAAIAAARRTLPGD